ncbi:MAG: hypothetical protein ACOH2N_19325 [Devosia sp.]
MKTKKRKLSVPVSDFRNAPKSAERPRMQPRKSESVERLLKLRPAAIARPAGGSEDEIALVIEIYSVILIIVSDDYEHKTFIADKFWNKERIKPKINDNRIAHHCVKFVYGPERDQARKISEIANALNRGLLKEHSAKKLKRIIKKTGSVRNYARKLGGSSTEVRIAEELREYLRKLAKAGEDLPRIFVRPAYTKNGITLYFEDDLVTEGNKRADNGKRSR